MHPSWPQPKSAPQPTNNKSKSAPFHVAHCPGGEEQSLANAAEGDAVF